MFANVFCYICNIFCSCFHAKNNNNNNNKNNKASFRTFERCSRSKIKKSLSYFQEFFLCLKGFLSAQLLSLSFKMLMRTQVLVLTVLLTLGILSDFPIHGTVLLYPSIFHNKFPGNFLHTQMKKEDESEKMNRMYPIKAVLEDTKEGILISSFFWELCNMHFPTFQFQTLHIVTK